MGEAFDPDAYLAEKTFDPDAYLAEKATSAPFDPDAYLAEKAAPAPFDPDAYLSGAEPELPQDIPLADASPAPAPEQPSPITPERTAWADSVSSELDALKQDLAHATMDIQVSKGSAEAFDRKQIAQNQIDAYEKSLIENTPWHPAARKVIARTQPVFEHDGDLYDTETATPIRDPKDPRIHEWIASKVSRNTPNAFQSGLAQFSSGIMSQVAGAARTLAPSIGETPALAEAAAGAGEMARRNNSTAAGLARGVGGAGALIAGNPAGKAGLLTGGARAALQTEAEARASGASSDEAAAAARKALALLPAYMAGGALAGKLGTKLAGETASPLAKGLSGFATASAGNVAMSGTLATIEGHPYTAENLGMDVAFGGLHGVGEGRKASAEVKASEQAAQRDVENIIQKGGEASELTSANKTLAERAAMLRPLSTEEAKVVATEGLDALETNGIRIPDGLKEIGPYFHGTHNDFTTFDPSRVEGGIHLGTKEQAQGRGPIVKEFSVRSDRPTPVVEDAGEWDHAPSVARALKGVGITVPSDSLKSIWRSLNDQGYDAIRYKNLGGEGSGESIMVQHAEQIKPKTEPARNLGPGAANVEEPLRTGKPIAAYNAAVDAQRAERGLEPLMSEARKADETTWDNMERKVEADPSYPDKLVADILAGRKTSVTDEEQAALLWQRLDLRNKVTAEYERMADETLTSEERAQAESNAAFAEELLAENDVANRKAGTESGRALRSRRLEANEDFTLAAMTGRARTAKGEPLTPEERGKITKLAEEGKQSEQALKDAEEQASVDEALRQQPSFDSRVWKYAEKLTKKWEDIGAKAWERFQSKMARASTGIDPTLLADLALFARGKIARGVYNLAKFTSDVISGAGEGARGYIKPAWDAAQQQMDSLADADVPKQFREKVKKVFKTKEEIATKRMEKRTAELEGRIAADDFAPRAKRVPLDLSKNPAAVAAQARLTSVQKQFKAMQRNWHKARRSNYEKTTDALWTGFTAERALMGSGDLSAPRQGARMAYSHPVMAARAMARSILTIFSQKRALGYEAARQLRPNTGEYKRMKMQQPTIEAEAHSRAAEEGVRSTIEDWADIKLTGYRSLSPPHLMAKLLGHYVKASSRTFTTFLNELSADVADFRLSQVKDTPMTKVEAEALGDMINSARGRGLKQGAGKLAQFLFYSANFLAARAKNLSGYHVWRRNSSMRIRKIALKEQVRALAGWLVVSNIARLFYGDKDDKESWEKKIKRMAGLTVTDKAQGIQYDYSGGEAAIARIGAMLFDGIKQTIQSSKEKGDGQRAYRSQAAVGRELRSKASPFLGVGMDWYFGSDYDGKTPTVLGSIKNITVPLTWRDADELFERAGFAKGTAAKVQEILGAGVTVKKR